MWRICRTKAFPGTAEAVFRPSGLLPSIYCGRASSYSKIPRSTEGVASAPLTPASGKASPQGGPGYKRVRAPPLPQRQASAPTGTYKAPTVRTPTMDKLLQLNDKWGLQLEEGEVRALRDCMANAVQSYQRVDELEEPVPPVVYPRTPGFMPSAEDNPYNAWYYKTDIRGAAAEEGSGGGKLCGRSVAVKDSIAVAGVPMMNGSRVLEGYTPDFDATVVTRVLDAGGVIAGKAVCEDLCCSGSSFATARGPVRNPHHEAYAAGGSSSGCGALVGGHAVDLAIGADQGGSIRIPASWCGIVGVKPTFGLVPYTGSSSHELTLDHLGPMARSVMDAAVLLEVLAGPDNGLDPRQPPNLTVPQYSKLVTGDVRGLRVGVVKEGLENCQADVSGATLNAAEALRSAGAVVEEVSIPMHRDSAAIWLPLCLEGGHATRMEGGGVGLHYKGYYPTSLQSAYDRGFRCHAAELSYTNKFYVLFGEYVRENYGKRYYAKCQNLSRALTHAYDAALVNCDVLLMPTLPIKPLRLLEHGGTATDYIGQAWCMLQNTAAFDLTGHPALSLNGGFSAPDDNEEGAALPIGVQVIGRHFEDAVVLNAAHAIETLLAADA